MGNINGMILNQKWTLMLSSRKLLPLKKWKQALITLIAAISEKTAKCITQMIR